MSTPKKSKVPVPQPLLKITFSKFPSKQVPIYFESKTRQFEASFGFDKYSAPSVAALEQKIQKAIKNGATPEPVWVPMIDLSVHMSPSYEQAVDFSFGLSMEREYFSIGAGGMLRSCDWKTNERARNKEPRECYRWKGDRFKSLTSAVFKPKERTWDGGAELHALIPYTDELWKELGTLVQGMRGDQRELIKATTTLDALRQLMCPTKKPAAKSTKSTPSTPKKPAAKKLPVSIQFDGKTIELQPGPLPGSLRLPLLKLYPDMQSAWLVKDRRIQLNLGIMGKVEYLSAAALEEKLKQPPLPIAEGARA